MTSFAAERFIGMDGDGLERLLVVVKASYVLDQGQPRLADEQAPIVVADEFAGEPDQSSLLAASDATPEKPSADWAVVGSAYPKAGRPAPESLVAIQIGPSRKAAVVTGDRAWVKAMGSVTITKPLPFTAMPLRWERSFGGKDETGPRPEWCAENPIGLGFRASGSKAPVHGARVPNVEDPTARMRTPDDRPRSIGFGPIPPSWSPRPRWAGTHDQRWQDERLPLPPVDFDRRFHHPVAPDQILPGYLHGGEPVTLAGVRPDGGYSFALPRLVPEIAIQFGSQRETPIVRCDTVRIDCEAQRLFLVARASTVVQGRVGRLRWIKIKDDGHVAT